MAGLRASHPEGPGGKGLVFNIQRFSIHDGPGIRTTVFLKGCPLRCKWCSNPESQASYPEIMTYDEKCIGCRKCVDACPLKAITFGERGRQIDRAKCDQCLRCARVCPAEGIKQSGGYMTVEEVLEQCERDLLFYENSRGGVTISGGEPLAQGDFVRELSRRFREKAIHVTLDTTGYAPWAEMEKALEYTNLVLYDLKHMDTAKHQEGTGVGNQLILENAKRISAKVRTWLRVPLIPGYNYSNWDIESVIEFARKTSAEKLCLLHYHELGASKYPRLGRPYPMQGTPLPNCETLERVKHRIESAGLTVTVGA